MISLNYRDSRPIYEQIKDGLKKLIVTGGLAVDEKLPSVRSLATQLSINPNTIQRAYNELEGEGYIYSVPGKGSFAAASAGADEGRKQELMDRVRELLDLVREAERPAPPAGGAVSGTPETAMADCGTERQEEPI